jgi:aminomethyltransferase
MVPFAGWSMPVQYTNVIEEHLATRNQVGLFDISHMGEFMITGEGAFEFLQSVVTNDLAKLETKQACYNCLCNERGTVIDDLFIYKLGDEEFFMVVNAGTIQKDLNWLMQHKPESVTIRDMSEQLAKLDLQGPEAEKTLQKLTQFKLEQLKRFKAEYLQLNNISPKVLISRTGYTGEDGFEIYCKNEDAQDIWNDLLEAGKEYGIKPCGLGARDTLRLEACYSLYGHELSESITPIEAGLLFVTKFNKEFIGREILEKQRGNRKETRLFYHE